MPLKDCFKKSKAISVKEAQAYERKVDEYVKRGITEQEAVVRVLGEAIDDVTSTMQSVYEQSGVEAVPVSDDVKAKAIQIFKKQVGLDDARVRAFVKAFTGMSEQELDDVQSSIAQDAVAKQRAAISQRAASKMNLSDMISENMSEFDEQSQQMATNILSETNQRSKARQIAALVRAVLENPEGARIKFGDKFVDGVLKFDQNDKKDNARVSSKEQDWQKFVETDTFKGASEEKTRTDRNVQAYDKKKVAPSVETIKRIIGNIQKALKASGITVQVYTQDNYNKVVAKVKGQGTQGVFVSDDGAIYLNATALSTSIEAGTIIWHEGSHPIINIIRNTQKETYDKMVAGIKELSKTDDSVKEMMKFVEEGSPQEQWDDEYTAEFMGRVADGRINLYKIKPTILDNIIQFINDIAKFFGLPKVIKPLSNIETIRTYASDITNALKNGEAIKSIVGKPNLLKYRFDVAQKRDESDSETNPNFMENAKKFANASEFPTKLEFKKALQDRLKKYLPELRKKYGKKFNPAVLDETTKKYVTDILTKEAINAITEHPEAIGWYDIKTQEALAVIALIHPEIETDMVARGEFIFALAVTSNGNKVAKNFEYAEDVYSKYKASGKTHWDEEGEYGIQQVAIKATFKMVNQLLQNGMSMEDINSFFVTKHLVGNLKYYDKKGKEKKMVTGESVSLPVFGAAILGPKIGNGFYMNLWGEFGQLTMDRWFMRTWGRVTNTLISDMSKQIEANTIKIQDTIKSVKSALANDPKQKSTLLKFLGFDKISQISESEKGVQKLAEIIAKRSGKKALRDTLIEFPLLDRLRKDGNNLYKNLQGEKEAPGGAVERQFIRDVFDDVQKRLKDEAGIDITMADLQAVLWYPEKILYESFKKGKTYEGIAQTYKTGEVIATEEEDEEEESGPPDYSNASQELARRKGIAKDLIKKTIDNVRADVSRGVKRGIAIDGKFIAELNDKVLQRIREAKGGEPIVTPKAPKAKKQKGTAQFTQGQRETFAMGYAPYREGVISDIKSSDAAFKDKAFLAWKEMYNNFANDLDISIVEDKNTVGIYSATSSKFEAGSFTNVEGESDNVRLFAALVGVLAPEGQHSVMQLSYDPNGTADLHTITFVDEKALNDFMNDRLKYGISDLSYVPDENAIKILDMGSIDKIKFLQDYGGKIANHIQHSVTANFVGEGDYSRVLQEAWNTYSKLNGQDAGKNISDAIELAQQRARRLGSDYDKKSQDAKLQAEQHQRDYIATSNFNIPITIPTRVDKVDAAYAKRILEAYEAMPKDDSKNPTVIEAYTQLARETEAQYKYLTDVIGINIEFIEDDPYPNSDAMFEDIIKNNNLRIYKGGEPHAFLGDTSRDEKGITANEKLRAVHDYFGHFVQRNQFGKIGEERAWVEHSKMFSPMAQWALTTETRGQNSWVNFSEVNEESLLGFQKGNALIKRGKVTEGNRIIASARAKFQFAEQKLALLPREFAEWRGYQTSPAQFSQGRRINAEIINGFYSPLENAINNLSQTKGIGSQMLSLVKKQKGVKSEELLYTGFENWLNGKDKVTKDEMLDFIKQNRIKIDEEILTTTHDSQLAVSLRRSSTVLLNKNYLSDILKFYIDIDPSVTEFNSQKSRFSSMLLLADYAGYEDADMERMMKENIHIELSKGNHSDLDFMRNGQFIAPKYYKDIYHLLYLTIFPVIDKMIKSDNYINNIDGFKDKLHKWNNEVYNVALENIRKNFADIANKLEEVLNKNKAMYGAWALKTGPTYKEILVKLNNEKTLYEAPHFDTESFNQNLLGHIRLQVLNTIDNKKVLFIEETQSDWGQEGKRQGFKRGLNEQEQKKINSVKGKTDVLLSNLKSYNLLNNLIGDSISKEPNPDNRNLVVDFFIKHIEPSISNSIDDRNFNESAFNKNNDIKNKIIDNIKRSLEYGLPFMQSKISLTDENILDLINAYMEDAATSGRVQKISKGRTLNTKTLPVFNEYDKDINEVVEVLKNLKSASVENAPYVTNTSSWLKLLLKFALKYAAQEDVDMISWASGEQQNIRFDRNVTAENFRYWKIDEENYGIKFDAYDELGDSITDVPQKANEKQLKEYFEKSVYEKVLNDKNPPTSESFAKKIKGEIQFTRPGMIGFYGDLNSPGVIGNNLKSLISDIYGEIPVLSILREKISYSKLDFKTNKPHSNLGINVPYELKESVKEGLAQFSQGRRINAEIINGFYSPIENAINELTQGKGSGVQMMAMIKKQKGIKEDELKFTGLEQWLLTKDKVTKEEMLEFIKQNRIKIRVTNQTLMSPNIIKDYSVVNGTETVAEFKYLDDAIDFIKDNPGVKYAVRQVDKAKYSNYVLSQNKLAKTDYKEIIFELPDESNEEYKWTLETIDLLKKLSDISNRIKELKDTMSYEDEMEYLGWKQEMRDWVEDEQAMQEKFDNFPDSVKEYHSLLADMDYAQLRYSDKVAEFKGLTVNHKYKHMHWRIGNVVVHARVAAYNDNNGERFFFMEETQSDWAQDAREAGTVSQEELDRIPVLQKEIADANDRHKLMVKKQAEYNDLVLNAQYEMQGLSNTMNDLGKKYDNASLQERSNDKSIWNNYMDAVKKWEVARDKWNSLVDKKIDYYTETNAAFKEYMDIKSSNEDKINEIKSKIPNAPYISNTSSWVKLGIKAAMIEAIKNGETRFAWATGQVQLIRWGTPFYGWQKNKDAKDGFAFMINSQMYPGFDDIEMAKNKIEFTKNQFKINKSKTNVKNIESVEKLKEFLEKTDPYIKRKNLEKLADKIWDMASKEDVGFHAPRMEGMYGFYGNESSSSVISKAVKEITKELTGIESQIKTLVVEGQDTHSITRVGEENGPIGNFIIPYIDITPEIVNESVKGMAQFSRGKRKMTTDEALLAGEIYGRRKSKLGAMMESKKTALARQKANYKQQLEKAKGRIIKERENLNKRKKEQKEKFDKKQADYKQKVTESMNTLRAKIAQANMNRKDNDALRDMVAAVFLNFFKANKISSSSNRVQAIIKAIANVKSFRRPQDHLEKLIERAEALVDIVKNDAKLKAVVAQIKKAKKLHAQPHITQRDKNFLSSLSFLSPYKLLRLGGIEMLNDYSSLVDRINAAYDPMQKTRSTSQSKVFIELELSRYAAKLDELEQKALQEKIDRLIEKGELPAGTTVEEYLKIKEAEAEDKEENDEEEVKLDKKQKLVKQIEETQAILDEFIKLGHFQGPNESIGSEIANLAVRKAVFDDDGKLKLEDQDIESDFSMADLKKMNNVLNNILVDGNYDGSVSLLIKMKDFVEKKKQLENSGMVVREIDYKTAQKYGFNNMISRLFFNDKARATFLKIFWTPFNMRMNRVSARIGAVSKFMAKELKAMNFTKRNDIRVWTYAFLNQYVDDRQASFNARLDHLITNNVEGLYNSFKDEKNKSLKREMLDNAIAVADVLLDFDFIAGYKFDNDGNLIVERQTDFIPAEIMDERFMLEDNEWDLYDYALSQFSAIVDDVENSARNVYGLDFVKWQNYFPTMPKKLDIVTDELNYQPWLVEGLPKMTKQPGNRIKDRQKVGGKGVYYQIGFADTFLNGYNEALVTAYASREYVSMATLFNSKAFASFLKGRLNKAILDEKGAKNFTMNNNDKVFRSVIGGMINQRMKEPFTYKKYETTLQKIGSYISEASVKTLLTHVGQLWNQFTPNLVNLFVELGGVNPMSSGSRSVYKALKIQTLAQSDDKVRDAYAKFLGMTTASSRATLGNMAFDKASQELVDDPSKIRDAAEIGKKLVSGLGEWALQYADRGVNNTSLLAAYIKNLVESGKLKDASEFDIVEEMENNLIDEDALSYAEIISARVNNDSNKANRANVMKQNHDKFFGHMWILKGFNLNSYNEFANAIKVMTSGAYTTSEEKRQAAKTAMAYLSQQLVYGLIKTYVTTAAYEFAADQLIGLLFENLIDESEGDDDDIAKRVKNRKRAEMKKTRFWMNYGADVFLGGANAYVEVGSKALMNFLYTYYQKSEFGLYTKNTKFLNKGTTLDPKAFKPFYTDNLPFPGMAGLIKDQAETFYSGFVFEDESNFTEDAMRAIDYAEMAKALAYATQSGDMFRIANTAARRIKEENLKVNTTRKPKKFGIDRNRPRPFGM